MILLKELGYMYLTSTSKRKEKVGIYRCGDCNGTTNAVIHNVLRGNTKRCMKCRYKNNNHNSKNKLYTAWSHLKSRCNNSNDANYKYYGGRGITYCKEWEKFEPFEEWANNNGYIVDSKLTIDRIDNDGNYEPSNCRWVSQTVQSRNTRTIHSSNTSGMRGVSIRKDSTIKKYISQITLNNISRRIGGYATLEEAGMSYDTVVREFNLEHGKNFTDKEYDKNIIKYDFSHMLKNRRKKILS